MNHDAQILIELHNFLINYFPFNQLRFWFIAILLSIWIISIAGYSIGTKLHEQDFKGKIALIIIVLVTGLYSLIWNHITHNVLNLSLMNAITRIEAVDPDDQKLKHYFNTQFQKLTPATQDLLERRIRIEMEEAKQRSLREGTLFGVDATIKELQMLSTVNTRKSNINVLFSTESNP